MAKKKVDIYKLTIEEALSVLSTVKEGRKLRVHAFQDAGIALMGFRIDLSSIKKQFKTSPHICFSGPNMLGAGHGVGFYNKKDEVTFLETDKEKLAELRKSKGVK